MKVDLIAHTQLSEEYVNNMKGQLLEDYINSKFQDGQVVALTAIRTCYSSNRPAEIFNIEGEKYFGSSAKDGELGTEADRLIRHIMRSGHLSTTEHITFTFAIEGVSRSLLAQLTRHRHFSFSVQSQRYVKLESESKSGGFDFVVPPSIEDKAFPTDENIWNKYLSFMNKVQEMYDDLRYEGIPAEDARYILPNATACNLVLTGNLRSILEFYSKRNPNTHAQWEIQELAERMQAAVIEAEPWTEAFFN